MNNETLSIKEVLTQIADPRKCRGKRFALVPILLLGCCATLCGYRSQKAIAEWANNYGEDNLRKLGFSKGIAPSRITIHRVFKALDQQQLEKVLAAWAEQQLVAIALAEGEIEAIAIDGKTLRGSRKQHAEESHLLSAISHRLDIVLGQLAVESKTNEISAILEFIDLLDLSGRVVTVDAMHTQRELAQKILSKGGDYLQVVKGNQKTLREDIELVFTPSSICEQRYAQDISEHADRLEKRSLWVSSGLNEFSDWPGMAQVMKLERTITNKRTKQTTKEIVYGVTSLSSVKITPTRLLQLWREHWHIENKVHYVRDVTFDEDRSQVRSGHLPQVLAALRNLAISLWRLQGLTDIAAATRRFAAQPSLAFAALGLLS